MPTCPSCRLYFDTEGLCATCASPAPRPTAPAAGDSVWAAPPEWAEPGRYVGAPPATPKRLDPLRHLSITGFVLVILGDVVMGAAQAGRLHLIGGLHHGTVSLAQVRQSDQFVRAAVLVHGLVLLLCAAAFVAWLHRAYGNLRRLGIPTRFGPGWAIGGWFVPILWWGRPKQIVDDLWQRSEPPNHAEDFGYRRVPGWVHAWWALWLVANVASTVASSFSAATLDSLHTKAIAELAYLGVDAAAAAFALELVRRITARQDAAARVITARSAQPPQLSLA